MVSNVVIKYVTTIIVIFLILFLAYKVISSNSIKILQNVSSKPKEVGENVSMDTIMKIRPNITVSYTQISVVNDGKGYGKLFVFSSLPVILHITSNNSRLKFVYGNISGSSIDVPVLMRQEIKMVYEPLWPSENDKIQNESWLPQRNITVKLSYRLTYGSEFYDLTQFSVNVTYSLFDIIYVSNLGNEVFNVIYHDPNDSNIFKFLSDWEDQNYFDLSDFTMIIESILKYRTYVPPMTIEFSFDNVNDGVHPFIIGSQLVDFTETNSKSFTGKKLFSGTIKVRPFYNFRLFWVSNDLDVNDVVNYTIKWVVKYTDSKNHKKTITIDNYSGKMLLKTNFGLTQINYDSISYNIPLLSLPPTVNEGVYTNTERTKFMFVKREVFGSSKIPTEGFSINKIGNIVFKIPYLDNHYNIEYNTLISNDKMVIIRSSECSDSYCYSPVLITEEYNTGKFDTNMYKVYGYYSPVITIFPHNNGGMGTVTSSKNGISSIAMTIENGWPTLVYTVTYVFNVSSLLPLSLSYYDPGKYHTGSTIGGLIGVTLNGKEGVIEQVQKQTDISVPDSLKSIMEIDDYWSKMKNTGIKPINIGFITSVMNYYSTYKILDKHNKLWSQSFTNVINGVISGCKDITTGDGVDCFISNIISDSDLSYGDISGFETYLGTAYPMAFIGYSGVLLDGKSIVGDDYNFNIPTNNLEIKMYPLLLTKPRYVKVTDEGYEITGSDSEFDVNVVPVMPIEQVYGSWIEHLSGSIRIRGTSISYEYSTSTSEERGDWKYVEFNNMYTSSPFHFSDQVKGDMSVSSPRPVSVFPLKVIKNRDKLYVTFFVEVSSFTVSSIKTNNPPDGFGSPASLYSSITGLLVSENGVTISGNDDVNGWNSLNDIIKKNGKYDVSFDEQLKKFFTIEVPIIFTIGLVDDTSISKVPQYYITVFSPNFILIPNAGLADELQTAITGMARVKTNTRITNVDIGLNEPVFVYESFYIPMYYTGVTKTSLREKRSVTSQCSVKDFKNVCCDYGDDHPLVILRSISILSESKYYNSKSPYIYFHTDKNPFEKSNTQSLISNIHLVLYEKQTENVPDVPEYVNMFPLLFTPLVRYNIPNPPIKVNDIDKRLGGLLFDSYGKNDYKEFKIATYQLLTSKDLVFILSNSQNFNNCIKSDKEFHSLYNLYYNEKCCLPDSIPSQDMYVSLVLDNNNYWVTWIPLFTYRMFGDYIDDHLKRSILGLATYGKITDDDVKKFKGYKVYDNLDFVSYNNIYKHIYGDILSIDDLNKKIYHDNDVTSEYQSDVVEYNTMMRYDLIDDLTVRVLTLTSSTRFEKDVGFDEGRTFDTYIDLLPFAMIRGGLISFKGAGTKPQDKTYYKDRVEIENVISDDSVVRFIRLFRPRIDSTIKAGSSFKNIFEPVTRVYVINQRNVVSHYWDRYEFDMKTITLLDPSINYLVFSINGIGNNVVFKFSSLKGTISSSLDSCCNGLDTCYINNQCSCTNSDKCS